MNAPTPTAQTEQHQTTRLNVDFSHRLSWAIHTQDLITPYGLNDCIKEITERAEAVLLVLESQFINPDDCRLNDSVIFNVIESVIRDIQDINSIVNAFSDAAHKQEKQNQQA